MNDNNSLAHTKWNCKYHIAFAPKYRRKIFYGEHQSGSHKPIVLICRDHAGLHGLFRRMRRVFGYAVFDLNYVYRIALREITN